MHQGFWARAARRAALLALACSLAAGAAELVLRRIPPSSLGYAYEDGIFRGPREFVEDTAVNAWGFHDVVHGGKRPGSRRVLLLGDSYVAALSMPVAATPGQSLERVLRGSSGGDTEVVSIGRPGWGQRNQLRALQRFGAAVRPDVVALLLLTFNDLSDNSPELRRAADEQLGRIASTRPGWTRIPAARAPLFFFPGSALNRLLSHRLALWLRPPETETPLEYGVYETPPQPRWQAAWQDTTTLLDALAHETAGLGARFVIATASTPHGSRGEAGLAALISAYPAMRAKRWDLDQPDRWVAEYCQRHGIAYVGLEAIFRRHTAGGESLHWKFDGHWNRAGNALAAAELGRLVAPALAPVADAATR